jgi:hypothetical protein
MGYYHIVILPSTQQTALTEVAEFEVSMAM